MKAVSASSKRRGMRGEPVLGPLEQDAGDQPLVALALRQPLPVGQRALEPVPADQELALLLEPADEQRPDPEQRLMRDLDLARPLVLADDEEPGARPGERREEPPAFLRHLVPLGRLADKSALVVDPHETRHEGLAERRKLGRARPRLGDDVGRGVADQRLERRQAGRGVAEALVFEEPETSVGAELVVDAAEREGDQRQRVGGPRIGCDPRHETVLDIEAGDPRRTADDVADPLDRQRPERELLELGVEARPPSAPRRNDRSGASPPRRTAGLVPSSRDRKARNASRRAGAGAGEQLLRLVDRRRGRRRDATPARRPARRRSCAARCGAAHRPRYRRPPP